MQSINIDMPDAEYFSVDDPETLQRVAREVADAPVVALDTETTGLGKTTAMPLFWSLSWGLPEDANRVVMRSDTLRFFDDAFKDPYKIWVFANAKFDMHMLANVNVKFAGHCADTQVMHSLLYEEMPHRLKFMMKHLFGWTWKGFMEAFPPEKDEGVGDTLLRVWREDPQKLIEYASDDAYGTLLAYWELEKRLEEEPTIKMLDTDDQTACLLDVFWEVEVPYTKVLWKCERHGAKIDTQRLKEIQEPLEVDLKQLERDIMRVTGGIVHNPNSNDQWSKYLYDHKKYPIVKRTKGGKKGIKKPSTDAVTRERLFNITQDEALKLADRHAKLSKLYGTYVMGLQNRLTSRGYVHTNFNQQVARCMPKGELVLTNRGYTPVEDVRVGDQVLTHMSRGRKVVETTKYFPQPIYRTELSNGSVLHTTGNHEYKTPHSWERADALQVGQEVVIHSDPEMWKTISEWEDFEVSTWGRVRNRKTNNVLAQYPKGIWGHLKLTLYRNGAQKRGVDKKDFTVHTLVLSAFDRTKPRGEELRHLNGIAWDNTVDNLVWGSSKDNSQDAHVQGTLLGRNILTIAQAEEIKRIKSKGCFGSSTSKLSYEIAEQVRKRYEHGEGRACIARDLGVSYQAIDSIIKHRTWTKPVTGHEIEFRTAKVVSVTKKAPDYTYGFTVEEDHSHITGGIVTHNTGRLTSSDPNMQNWPRRDEDVYKLRDALICEPGDTMLVFDYCLAPATRVLHSDLSWSRIDTIQKGDELIGFDEELRNAKYRRSIVEGTKTLQRPCTQIVTDKGTVIASNEHMWVVRPGRGDKASLRRWVKTEDIQPGDRISFYHAPWEEDTTHEGGYLAGIRNASKMWEGSRTWSSKSQPATVLRVEDKGTRPVIAIQTSTRTFIAEGFLSHNCQLEMRILADMAQESAMIDMINAGRDIHMGNASIVFDVPYDDIQHAKKMKPEQWEALASDQIEYYQHCLFCRQAAKAIGFGQPTSQAEVKLPQNSEPYGPTPMATLCCAARHSLSTCARPRRASTGRRRPDEWLVMPHVPLTRGARRRIRCESSRTTLQTVPPDPPRLRIEPSQREGIVSTWGNSGAVR